MLLVVALFVVAVVVSFIVIFRFIREQREINEALADYVAADLLKTWEASAEALVEKLRGAKDDLADPNS